MRKFAALIIVLLLVPTAGCPKKLTSASSEPLVPVGREREILRAYGVSADTPAGQKRLLKLRARRDKLAASRERVRGWAEAKSKQEETTTEAGEEDALIGDLTYQE